MSYTYNEIVELEQKVSRLLQQRAELLEALKGMIALDEENHQRYAGDEDVCYEVRIARAAIKSAEAAE